MMAFDSGHDLEGRWRSERKERENFGGRECAGRSVKDQNHSPKDDLHS